MPAKTLHFQSPRHLSQLYAGHEENLAHAERALGVKLVSREDWLRIDAPDSDNPKSKIENSKSAAAVAVAESLFTFLNDARTQGMTIRPPDFHRIADTFARGEG